MYREMGAANASPLSTQDDAALLSAWCRRATRTRWRRCSTGIRRSCTRSRLRVLRDPASAEDVLQEIFMQIWRNPDSFIATRGSLGGWLAVVSRNRSIDALRRKRPSEQVDDMALASPYNLADEAERNSMMERARERDSPSPDRAAEDARDGVLRRSDPLGDRRDDGRPAGHSQDPNTQRSDDAEKGIQGMNATGHIEQDDLALFAMQLLPADESAAIAEHIESCAECRRELAAIQGDLAVVCAYRRSALSSCAGARAAAEAGGAREKGGTR